MPRLITAAEAPQVVAKHALRVLLEPTTHTSFPALENVNRPAVETAAAAYYLNRRPQTLRGWACKEDGPLRPWRINGRLAWPTIELRRILSGGKA